MDDNLPIDIQCRKLLDWLVSRRVCPKDWHKTVLQIREKIGNALKDMPEHPAVRDLLSGSEYGINYFHCLEIVEILKETEASTKNFFGGYSSQRMSDWKAVVSSYQKDQVYIAEAAQLLIQSVSYDVPALKKQIQKCSQTQEECDKKVNSNERKIEEFRQEFQKGCVSLGISLPSDTDNQVNKTANLIRKEILSLLGDLPKIYDGLASDCKGLDPYIKMYAEFINKVHDLKSQNGEASSNILPDLSFLIERGNVTTYEWVHGEPPLSIIHPADLQMETSPDEDEACDQIDFDIGDEGGAEIDFDLGEEGVQGLNLEVGDIDWGDIGDTPEGGGGGDDIDWDIVTAEDGGVGVEGSEEEGVVITLEESGNEGGVARDSDALTLLDNRKTRNLILDELHELQAFYIQRKAEMSASDSSGGSGRLALVPSEAGEITEKDVEAAISKTGALISALTTGKLHHLQLVRGSGKYVDRLVGDLKQKLRLIERTRQQSEELRERREGSSNEEVKQRKTLADLVTKTKVLQGNVEKDISGRYNGRRVNIMGGIQTLS